MKAGFLSDPFLVALGKGYFPMAESRDSEHVYFLNPEERALFLPQKFRVPARLKRRIKAMPYHLRADTAFAQVISACAASAPGRDESWINQKILDAYLELHQRGCAHSLECWQGDRLVGGLYGVELGGAFFGESMFSHERDASKIALVYLMAQLIAGGFLFLDAQFPTPHLEQFGLSVLPQKEFLLYLKRAKEKRCRFFALEENPPPGRVLQLIGQTL